MARIIFLDQTSPFDGHALRSGPLGGIQSGTVLLAEAFARRGHEVTAFTLTERATDLNGVAWRPLDTRKGASGDLAIANNHLTLFDGVAAAPIVWFRNRTSFSRLWRRKSLLPLLRHRPHAVFLSAYHRGITHPLMPFASRRIIEHGVGAEFRRTEPADAAPAPKALFTSQPYRGLEWLIDIWRDRIHPAAPHAELHVFTPKTRQAPIWLDAFGNEGIIRRESIAKADLAQELRGARVLLYPGHKDETYCNAAAEATASGLPIVTRGFGSLDERVDDGATGFIAPDAALYAERAIRLLTDDALWLDQHRAALHDPKLGSWDDRAAEWERAFLAPGLIPPAAE